ncbi:MAG: DNA mismatch repair protein MutS, partial [Firmicutes bacterium]|nr:DNA mismatch repair protein MutS [Bacillota bacterium]
MTYTPMIQQYLQIKQNYNDYILFFRMGDFYEMFFDDALQGSRELEITLTARDGGGGKKVPMCGVPHHAAETYITRLIKKGRRVAVCEQVEDPGQVKGLVKREVVRVITPGTALEGQYLDEKKNNYLAAVLTQNGACGLAYADFSTGHFYMTQFEGETAVHELVDELARLQPAELLMPIQTPAELKERFAGCGAVSVNGLDETMYQRDRAMQIMERQFGPGWLSKDAGGMTQGLRAAGAVILYLEETQKRSLQQMKAPQFYLSGQYMKMDAATRRNLELTASIKDGSRWGTLIQVLDYTGSAMGGRLLKQWLEQPLVDISLIGRRLDAVAELLDNLILRRQLRESLKKVYDLERLSGRVAFGTANARDLLALRKSFDLLPGIKQLLSGCGVGLLQEIRDSLDDMRDMNQLLHRAIEDDPPLSIRDGGIFREGYHPEVDKLRSASLNGKNWLAGLEMEERVKTGIKSLKVGYNKVFGYYLEVTRSNLAQVPDNYIRKQTLVNAERFITPRLKEYEEMITGAENRLVQLEHRLFVDLREKVTGQVRRIQETAARLAVLDVLSSFGEAAEKGDYIRPAVNQDRDVIIRDGRHPVVERMLGPGGFVPNDTLMNLDNRLILLTGPNMAGKSTYMRQVALMALMAQAGSFVPASGAEIGVMDRIFTRIGAADDLAGGQSTFMVEMSECRGIVNYATPKSLIIMDEVGRGTSTYDGISIARALFEFIHDNIGARTLFS